jgi:hypothetical protein
MQSVFSSDKTMYCVSFCQKALVKFWLINKLIRLPLKLQNYVSEEKIDYEGLGGTFDVPSIGVKWST